MKKIYKIIINTITITIGLSLIIYMLSLSYERYVYTEIIKHKFSENKSAEQKLIEQLTDGD